MSRKNDALDKKAWLLGIDPPGKKNFINGKVASVTLRSYPRWVMSRIPLANPNKLETLIQVSRATTRALNLAFEETANVNLLKLRARSFAFHKQVLHLQNRDRLDPVTKYLFDLACSNWKELELEVIKLCEAINLNLKTYLGFELIQQTPLGRKVLLAIDSYPLTQKEEDFFQGNGVSRTKMS